jgi:hypothetical protein
MARSDSSSFFKGNIVYQENTQTGTVSTTSSTWTGITNTQIDIEKAGTYMAIFTGSVELDGVNVEGEVRLELDGVAINGTVREHKIGIAILGLITLSTTDMDQATAISTVFTANAGQTIRPAFRELNNDTFIMHERNLTIIRLER